MSTKLERQWLFRYEIPQAPFLGHAQLLRVALEIPADLFSFIL